jgi:hypothetical protein
MQALTTNSNTPAKSTENQARLGHAPDTPIQAIEKAFSQGLGNFWRFGKDI